MKTVSPTRTFTAVAMSSKGKVIHFCHLDFQICIGNEKDFSRTSLGPLQLGSVFTSAFLPKINYCTNKNWVYFCHFYRFINHGYSTSEDFILFECAALSIKDVTYLLPAIWGCSTEKLFRGVQENLNNICGRILFTKFPSPFNWESRNLPRTFSWEFSRNFNNLLDSWGQLLLHSFRFRWQNQTCAGADKQISRFIFRCQTWNQGLYLFFTAAKVFESLLHNFELLRQTSSRPRTKLFKGNHINSSDQNIKQHLKAKSTEKLVNLD